MDPDFINHVLENPIEINEKAHDFEKTWMPGYSRIWMIVEDPSVMQMTNNQLSETGDAP